MTDAARSDQPKHHRATQNEKLVIAASSLGTVFEWYDFYLYGLLATFISSQFFSGVNETTGFILALAAFAAGFAVRPFGALVFGRIGSPPTPRSASPRPRSWSACACSRAWRWAANMAGPRPMSPNMPPMTGAASTRAGSRRPPPSACSRRCWW
jgi:MFS family permease